MQESPNGVTSLLKVTFCPSAMNAMYPSFPSDQRFSSRNVHPEEGRIALLVVPGYRYVPGEV
jgi:hypothetical protein